MKKLFAILALSLSTSVFAQVSIFGTMDAGMTTSKAPGANTDTTNFTSGGMTTSNIGVKGSENLGKGTTAVFELSSFLNNGNGATLGGSTPNLFARSAFVGLGNKTLGTVTLGRQVNPSFLPIILFNAYGDSSAYSPLWHATYFGNTGNPATQVFNDTAWDNSVAYTSPNFNGVTTYVAASKTGAGQNSGGNVMYFKDGLGLMAFWQRTEVNSSGSFQNNIFTANKAAEASGLGASYDAKVAKVFATYTKTDAQSANIEGATTQVSALVPAGHGKVMAQYAVSNFKQSGVAKDVKEWAVGYDYNLSKRTDVYATIGRASVTGLTDGQTVGAGLRHRF